MEGAYAFTCQLCRARLTLVGSLEAAPGTESAAWAGGRGLLVPPHLQASVFDQTNVDESFIILDGKRQGPTATPLPHPLPPQHAPHHAQPQHPQHPQPALPGQQQHLQQQHPQRGLEESFVMLGSASVLRPPAGAHPHHPPGLSPMYLRLLQQQQQQQLLSQQQAGPAGGPAAPPGNASQQQQSQQQQAAASLSPPSHQHQQHQQGAAQASPNPPSLPGAQRGVGAGAGPGGGAAGGDVDGGGGSPGGPGGGAAGSGLDSKLQALAQLFELASTNTQVDHPLCMDCVGQLKEEMDAQITEAEREITAYGTCLAQLEGGLAGSEAAAGLGGGGGGQDAEEYRLEEVSRLEQERDQERARAEVLELDLAAVASELASLSAAAADLDSLEERYWHDVNDFELLLRSHTDERGALLAKIDRAGQRLQLLKNTSVLYDAFKIWHDGPFGTISGFRLGRTPEVSVEWDEINAAWGQAVLLLHTMAQMCKLQFSQHRLLPMGSHPRVADKRSTYDLFGPVSKLWSANYDRAMVAFLACLREFGEAARRKDVQDGKPTHFNFPFAIDGDKVNNHTIKLTLNKDVRWTKALKFMLANLKIALQWCVKQDQGQEAPQLQQLQQEGPQVLPEH